MGVIGVGRWCGRFQREGGIEKKKEKKRGKGAQRGGKGVGIGGGGIKGVFREGVMFDKGLKARR